MPRSTERLAALYARVPDIDCQGKCASECTTVPCGPAEAKRLAGGGAIPSLRPSGHCPHLNGGRCTVHKIRPMLCRLYGVWESLPCRYGCKPDRMLSATEGRALLNQAMEIK